MLQAETLASSVVGKRMIKVLIPTQATFYIVLLIRIFKRKLL